MGKALERMKRGESGRIARYLKETRAEINKVTWPTREQATRLTLIVLAVTAALAVVLALVDFVFAWLVARMLGFDPIAFGIVLALIAGVGVWYMLGSRQRSRGSLR